MTAATTLASGPHWWVGALIFVALIAAGVALPAFVLYRSIER